MDTGDEWDIEAQWITVGIGGNTTKRNPRLRDEPTNQ